MTRHARIRNDWYLRQVLGTTDQWEIVKNDTNETVTRGSRKVIIHREAKGYYMLKNLSVAQDFVFDTKEEAFTAFRTILTYLS